MHEKHQYDLLSVSSLLFCLLIAYEYSGSDVDLKVICMFTSDACGITCLKKLMELNLGSLHPVACVRSR
jgi:hypothetical protein